MRTVFELVIIGIFFVLGSIVIGAIQIVYWIKNYLKYLINKTKDAITSIT